MALLDWLGWHSPPTQRASVPAVPTELPGANVFGAGISETQASDDILLRESGGLNDIAGRAIAARLSSLKPQVKVERRVTDGTTVDEVLDDHPLALLFKRPHPSMSWLSMMRLAGLRIVTVGQEFWLKVGNGLGVPIELHPMRPGKVKPLVEMGVVIGYSVQDERGKLHTVPSDAMIRFYFPDPDNHWLARGYLGPNGVLADLHKFSTQHLRRHYQFNATPKLVLEPQEGAQAFTPDQTSRFEAKFGGKYNTRNGTAEGTPFVIPTFYKLIALAMESGADVTPLLQYADDYILKAYGVPNSILGRVVSGDRSSAETNQYVFDMHTVLPIAEMMADALTNQLAGDFDTNLSVGFENFISDDKEFEIKRQAHRIEHAIDTINDVREDEGGDTVDWGDQPLIANTLGPYDPAVALEAQKNAAKPQPPPVGPNAPPAGNKPRADADDEQAERAEHIRIRREFAARRKAQRAA